MRTERRDARYRRLDSLADVAGGVALGGSVSSGSSVELPYLRVANVQDGYIDTGDIKTLRVPISSVERFRLRRGDVLLTEGGDFDKLGRGSVWDGRIDPCVHQNHVFRVRCVESELIPEFLALYMASPEARSYFLGIAKQTTNLATISSSQLKAMPVPSLPLSEQQRIVDVIDAVSAQERAIGASIAKLVTVQLAAAEELLCTVDQKLPLGDVLKRLQVGVASTGPESIPSPGEWGVIRLGAVTSGRFESAQVKRLPDSVTPRPELEIRSGDVLMVRVNGSPGLVGSVCIVEDAPTQLMLSDLVMRLVANLKIADPEFLGLILSLPVARRQITSRLRGTSGQFQLPQSELKSVLLPCPSLARQRKIVASLATFEVEVARERDELSKIRLLRQGLVDSLLPGGA